MRRFDKKRLFTQPLLVSAIALAIATPASADDLDVFNAVLASQVKPNIVFLLDYSGSMKQDTDGNRIASDDDVTLSKVEILNEAVNAVLDANSNMVNAGIASIYKKEASGVRWPVSDLEADAHELDPAIPAGQFTNADIISKQLKRTDAHGSTPTVNALAEAAAYFRGDPVTHAGADINLVNSHKPDVWDVASEQYQGGNSFAAIPSSYDQSKGFQFDVDGSGYDYCTDYDGGTQNCAGKEILSCERTEPSGSDSGYSYCTYKELGAWTTPNYISPIAQQCQANFIILISDGRPTVRNDTPALDTVLNAAGVSGIDDCEPLSPRIFSATGGYAEAGDCGPEIVNYLATTDINPDVAGSNVQTYPIGFALEGTGAAYLQEIADYGNPTRTLYEAKKPEDLTNALNSILDAILSGSQSFAELTIDVNPDTFSHDDKTFFSLFTPRASSSWEGNLKGFFLGDTGLLDIHGAPATFDSGNGLAFADTSQSFWSAAPDGNEVNFGGASESITSMAPAPNARNMYTYINGNSPFLSTDDDNLLINVDESLMGSPGDVVRDSALNWLSNAPMGDPLHTKPVVVSYGTDKRVVFTMTNQGFLHAFDASTPMTTNSDTGGGEELFAFMPQELIPNIPALATPSTTFGEHIYGLDGGITRWHTDYNKNGKVDGADTMLLVFGMRRGGSSYYALDVTDPENPEFKWQISPDMPKFGDMAQTWSRPALINVNHGGTEELVLLFSGGYDADTVDGTTRSTRASGNAIFMVDAGGDHVWSIGSADHPKMAYSIPTDPTVIDADSDGVADRVYFGDLGGQMWRVDFDDVSSGADTNVNLFADVTNGVNDHQPIFYAPSVSLNREDGDLFLAISFGTGDRTDPLNPDSQNALYMLRDKNYKVGPPLDHPDTTIRPAKIADLTENLIGSTDKDTSDDAKEDLASKSGWKVNLNRSEKALAEVTTYEGKFMTTTFEPQGTYTDSGELDPCGFETVGRLYIMDILDATPIQLLEDGTEITEGLDKEHRVTILKSTAIPSKLVVVHPPKSDKAQLIVGTETVANDLRDFETVYWHAK